VVKRVAIDHVRGFDSRLCLFFLHMENGIRVGFLSFLLSKYSYRNPTNGSSSEIPTFLGNSDQTKSDRTQTKIARNLSFHVNLAGRNFNWNLVGLLGVQSENSDSYRTPIGIGGGV
jgi:hypothetical protein